MRSSLYNIFTKQILILILCGIYAVIQASAFATIVAYPFYVSIITGLFEALIFAGLGILLWKVIRFGNYSALETYQRIINYSALGILVITVWLVISSLFFYMITGEKYLSDLYIIIRIKALIGILLYITVTQVLHYKLIKEEDELISEKEDELDEKETKDKQEDETKHRNTEDLKESIASEIIERIAVKVGQKIHVILVSDIIYIQSDGDYVQIYTDSGKYLKEDTMKYFEMHLPTNSFVRVHRSYIVNVEKILRIELYEKKNQLLTLTNGDKIKASTAGYKELRSVLGL